MARAGINYIDVSRAAQAIQSNGQNPTVDRVLAHLGTGSKSTIAPLLKQWKVEQSQVADAAGLPDDILKSVKSIHDRLQQSAEVKIEQAIADSQTQISEAKDVLAAATAEVARLKQDNDQLKTQQESDKAENIDLRGQLEAEHITVARLTSDNEYLTSQLDQAKTGINEQKRETRHIRENFEHYQTQAAEDRQLEREQYQISKRQLEERIHAITQQLGLESRRTEALDNEKKELTIQVKQITGELVQMKEDLQAEKLNTTVLAQKLELKVSQQSELEETNQELNSKYKILISENSELLSARQLIELDLEQVKFRLTEAEEKLSILDDENKIILQEKAMLQGQFKQLQDSM